MAEFNDFIEVHSKFIFLFFFVLRASELIAMRKVSGLEVLVFSHVIYEVAIWIVLDTALLESS